MYRLLFITLFIASFASAQNKKPLTKKSAAVAKTDSLKKDSVAEEKEMPIPKEFAVYTKRTKDKKGRDRLKLCVNLVKGDSILNYCVFDSICKDPEISKIMFEKQVADSNYVLVHVQAFSKPVDKPSCDAGKETKLLFVRWNVKTNQAHIQTKIVESCMRGITRMTNEPIEDWDASGALSVRYHLGGTNFVESTFDPQNFLSGIQTTADK